MGFCPPINWHRISQPSTVCKETRKAQEVLHPLQIFHIYFIQFCITSHCITLHTVQTYTQANMHTNIPGYNLHTRVSAHSTWHCIVFPDVPWHCVRYIALHHMTYLPTYIHTYVHTYIHTYVHTYIHACMHTLHYITLHYITFHYITLHTLSTYIYYIYSLHTLHYIHWLHTLITYINYIH